MEGFYINAVVSCQNGYKSSTKISNLEKLQKTMEPTCVRCVLPRNGFSSEVSHSHSLYSGKFHTSYRAVAHKLGDEVVLKSLFVPQAGVLTVENGLQFFGFNFSIRDQPK